MAKTDIKIVISKNETITEKLLSSYYDTISDGGELYIERKQSNYDFNKISLMLRNCGFKNVVTLRNSLSKGTKTIRCIKGAKEELLLSVIVPLYNEENTAGELLDKLINRKWTLPVEFVIVESNSKDRTREIAKSYESHPQVTLVLEDKPSGKGNGVLRGIKEAKGNIIAIQDGDLEYDVEDYDKLLEPIINKQTKFVLGSRYNKDDWRMRKFAGNGRMIADYLNLGQVMLTGLLNFACASKLTDPFTMYKIFDVDCMHGINFVGGNFGLDWEIVIRFLRKGYKPVELPISYKARSYEEGKHIALLGTPIEGLKALWHSRIASSVYDYGDK